MKLWISIYTTGISKPFNVREKMACKAVLNRTGVPRKNLWKICCDLVRYDGLGSEECFGSELQGWEVRRCCSSLQDRNLTTRLWARVLFPTDIRSVKPVSQNISRFAIVAYHKSGASLSYVIATLPELSLLLLGRGFRNFGWAKSYSTSHIPTYQGGVYLQTHRSLLQRVITYWLSPMEMMREEISSNYLVPGLGKQCIWCENPVIWSCLDTFTTSAHVKLGKRLLIRQTVMLVTTKPGKISSLPATSTAPTKSSCEGVPWRMA